MFNVICINDSHKPNDIPTSQWIVKNREYFVIEVCKMKIQGGLLGFKLAEINLDGCAPYQYYASNRFGITKQELDKMISEKKIVVTKEKELV